MLIENQVEGILANSCCAHHVCQVFDLARIDPRHVDAKVIFDVASHQRQIDTFRSHHRFGQYGNDPASRLLLKASTNDLKKSNLLRIGGRNVAHVHGHRFVLGKGLFELLGKFVKVRRKCAPEGRTIGGCSDCHRFDEGNDVLPLRGRKVLKSDSLTLLPFA